MAMVKKLGLGLAVCVLTMQGALADEQCGDVTIADMSWASATFIANIDKMILTEGYDCKVKLVPGDTILTTTSMIEKNQPDLAPEMWINSAGELLESGVKQGKLRRLNKTLSEGGVEGFWVPKYLVDKQPELATISGIKANAKLFKHPEDPGKSMFMGCPSGWGCQIASEHLFQALNLKQAGFDLVDPGSGAGLAGAIAKAYERQQPWFGYYWAPTAVLGRYEMVKVDFEETAVDNEHFKSCIANENCENPQVTPFPPAPAWNVITEQFAQRSPAAVSYLEKRSFTNAEMNKLLAWVEENQADGEYAAYQFMVEHENIWTRWVPADIATKVRKSL